MQHPAFFAGINLNDTLDGFHFQSCFIPNGRIDLNKYILLGQSNLHYCQFLFESSFTFVRIHDLGKCYCYSSLPFKGRIYYYGKMTTKLTLEFELDKRGSPIPTWINKG